MENCIFAILLVAPFLLLIGAVVLECNKKDDDKLRADDYYRDLTKPNVIIGHSGIRSDLTQEELMQQECVENRGDCYRCGKEVEEENEACIDCGFLFCDDCKNWWDDLCPDCERGRR